MKGEPDHVCCDKARLKKAASGRNIHGTVESNLTITGGKGPPANNAKGSFRSGESVRGKDKLGYG